MRCKMLALNAFHAKIMPQFKTKRRGYSRPLKRIFMQIATWNVNSLTVRLPQVIDWLKLHQPAALCLQELKMEDHKFPIEAFAEIGYQAVFSGQKTYNGVAIVARHDLEEIQIGIPNFEDTQKRVIAATVQGVRLICAYFPNGESPDSEKFQYKLAWLHALLAWLPSELARYPKLALLGDYNIAPEDADVHNPAQWIGKNLVSDAERKAFTDLQSVGLNDAFRAFPQAEKSFTWWDYRAGGFQRNHGLRIDHILTSAALSEMSKRCWIDSAPRKLERPSDHAPVVLELGILRCGW